MSKYIISQPESEKNMEETTIQGQEKKKKRRKYIKPAGEREHSINSISPKLRTSPIVEIPIEKQKSITIALIGPPNVGKSTILNKFVGDKVTATSSKAQTTRIQVIGCSTIGDTQLVFVDTPGVIDKNLQAQINRTLIISSWTALNGCDLVIIMADLHRTFTRESYSKLYYVLDSIKQEYSHRSNPIDTIMILNKLDLLPIHMRQNKIDQVSAKIASEFPFIKRIFSTSALSNVNIESIHKYLMSLGKSRAWEYSSNTTAVMSDYQRVMEVIREKIYRRMNQEIPYLIEQKNIDWTEMSDGVTVIENVLFVRSEAQLKMLVGAGGRTLKYISTEAQESLKEIFGKPFKIVLSVKVRKQPLKQFANVTEEENLLGYRLTPSRTSAELAYATITRQNAMDQEGKKE